MLGSILNFQNRISTLIYLFYIKNRFPNVKIGKNFTIYGKFKFMVDHSSKVIFGNNIRILSSTKYNYVGINKPVSICVKQNANLFIGDYTGFSGTTIYASNHIAIGKFCNFGGNVFIWDTDFHPLEYIARRKHELNKIKSAPIIIGNDVFIGANSIILKGVTIGDRSVIGAGSVVSKSIPPDEIWAGNPIKFVKKINNI